MQGRKPSHRFERYKVSATNLKATKVFVVTGDFVTIYEHFTYQFQGLAGDIHFDDDETWSLNGRQGTTDLLWTSLHEIGHAIGLEHSQKRDAIMWPWFEGYQAGLKLRQDDISGIQSIYGTVFKCFLNRGASNSVH